MAVCDFAISRPQTPSLLVLVRRFGICTKDCRTHPSGAPGINLKVVSGAAQFKLGVREAI
eukprot:668029-Alexandrium_andersonii.AAC.1